MGFTSKEVNIECTQGEPDLDLPPPDKGLHMHLCRSDIIKIPTSMRDLHCKNSYSGSSVSKSTLRCLRISGMMISDDHGIGQDDTRLYSVYKYNCKRANVRPRGSIVKIGVHLPYDHLIRIKSPRDEKASRSSNEVLV